MRRRLPILALLMSVAGPVLAQTPDPGKPVYVTSHVDVTSEHVDQTVRALKAYAQAARKEPGAIRVEALQEPRSNHFDLVEVWRNRAAFEAHAATAATIRFHDTIHPWRGSPFEERLGSLIAP